MKIKNDSYMPYTGKLFPLLLMLLFVNLGWGQYTGTGSFQKITSIGSLTDGYYVVVNSGNAFVMNNTTPGSYIGNSAITLTSGAIANPSTGIVWKIQTTGSEKTIFNEASSKYVSYSGSSNSAQLVSAGTTDSEKWTITYEGSEFKITNKGTSTRLLQYNAGSPRFACYTGSQQNILLYKLTVATNAAPVVSDVAITGLPNTGVQLSGSYIYADAENNPDTSTFKWYTATDNSGAGETAIDGATASNYTLTASELGKYVRFGVTAASSAGTSPGVEAFSPWIGPITASGSPALSAGTLSDFTPTCLNATSVANSFNLVGNNLTGNVSVGPLTGFTFSQTENGTYTASLSISPASNAINLTIYVKFKPTAVQSYDGNISISGGGASSINVATVGSGINTPATTITGTAAVQSSAVADIAGSLSIGCSAVTAYGIAYSTTSGFTTGTAVASTNLAGGNFTLQLSGLQSNTEYFYKAYATDATETVYGTQNSFTTLSIGAPGATANVTATGFTATWNAVPGATSYELDVYEKTAGSVATNLIISEYGEGNGGNKKYIEIFNGTGASVELSNYELWSISNGGSWPESMLALTGTLLDNDTYVIANNNTDVIGADLYSTSLNYNGDDAVGLAYNGGAGTTFSLIDAVGVDGPDPGTGWEVAGTANATVDKILIRKSSVLSPTTNWATSAGTSVENSQWIVSSFVYNNTNQTTNLGSHTFAGASTNTYVFQNLNVGNVTSYVVTGLNPSTDYYYVVRAKDANSTSANSNEIGVTTLPFNDNTIYANGAWNNGVPTASMNAIINDNFTTTGNLTAKSLTINAGKTFTVATGHTLTVVNAITNNSEVADSFVVQNNGVLIQNSNTATNSGMFTVKRTSANLFREDYTLWSSPVSGQNLRNFSPATLFNRFYSYNTASGTNGDYFQEIVTTADVNSKVFEVAKGYLIRMPNNWVINVNSNVAQPYLGAFKGNLNNGTISIPLSTAVTKYNLVGNPYASPIAIDAFFAANPDIEETLYFWRKTNGAANSGYATSNKFGVVSSGQPELNGVTNLFNIIKPGQGFFIQNKTATALNFNNGMRSNTAGTFFFKGSNDTNEVNRFWLNLSNATDVVGQTLVGYATGATQGIDSGLDALYFNDSPLALTSLINDAEYIIQGRSLPFTDADVVALGFKTNQAGTFTISLANFDGLFATNQAIYLKDKATNTLQNLKIGSYTFNAGIGVFNDRFEVQYNGTLGTDNPELIANNILIAVKNQQVKINAGSVIMNKIELIDIAGRVIFTQENVNATTITIDALTATNQMLIVRITTKENGVVNQKIVF